MARYYDLDKLSEMIEARADQLLEGKEAFLYIAKWLNLLPTADVAQELLSALKIEAHNKAVYPCGGHVDPYISLKVLDGIIQKYLNELKITDV